jgi:NADPH:quinone reductase-like Zn-dependent oxidoreductase
MAAPVNPSDLLFLEGRYPNEKILPSTPGFEGAGIIV